MMRIVYPPEAIAVQVVYRNDIASTHFCEAHKICSNGFVDSKTNHFRTIQPIGFIHVKSGIKLYPQSAFGVDDDVRSDRKGAIISKHGTLQGIRKKSSPTFYSYATNTCAIVCIGMDQSHFFSNFRHDANMRKALFTRRTIDEILSPYSISLTHNNIAETNIRWRRRLPILNFPCRHAI